MDVSTEELTAVLAHCRLLSDAADELESIGDRLEEAAQAAVHAWRGPKADDLRVAAEDHRAATSAAARTLRVEADAWAQAWADAVNGQNARAAAAEFGGGVLTRQPLGAYQPVPPPSAATGWSATGTMLW